LIHDCPIERHGLSECCRPQRKIVITGLDPVIHASFATDPVATPATAWIRGSSPRMTTFGWFRSIPNNPFPFAGQPRANVRDFSRILAEQREFRKI
jgi:hypothetical protein